MTRSASGIAAAFAALLTLLLLNSGPAPARLVTTLPTDICSVLAAQHAASVKAMDYVQAGVASQTYAEHGCPLVTHTFLTSLTAAKICKPGIKNIATFLLTCPTADGAYGTVVVNTPISFDFTPVDALTLATDVTAVCKNKAIPSMGGPTLRQREEFVVVQAMRTIYYMDSQGDTGCSYPWTAGRSVYKWMTALVGGIDIRDDTASSECCDYPPPGGTRSQIVIVMPDPAKIANLDLGPDNFSWWGDANVISLIAHETRHEPIPPSSNYSYTHVGCCPVGGQGCDQTYDESNLSAYGIEYWLFRAWVTGQVNVGYGCMADTTTTGEFVTSANGFLNRFCTALPPKVMTPAKPGGTCPP